MSRNVAFVYQRILIHDKKRNINKNVYEIYFLSVLRSNEDFHIAEGLNILLYNKYISRFKNIRKIL